MLAMHRSLLSDNYAENKKVLSEVCEIQSKWLLNKVAGYITSVIRKEAAKKEAESEEEEYSIQLDSTAAS